MCDLLREGGDHVLLPCGHGGYCGDCAHTLLGYRPPKRVCPMCRTSLTSVAKVTLSTPIGAEAEVLESSVGKPYVPPPKPRRDNTARQHRERGAQRGRESIRRHRSESTLVPLDLDATRRERRARR
ncbi:MAG: RING-HC finger protein, partial [Akkermansiaceae bacterium]|nr:RING-HC finger protein [Akkermansiaceae bacterium]